VVINGYRHLRYAGHELARRTIAVTEHWNLWARARFSPWSSLTYRN
jgi:hypothetical protein